jgi:hypothetical protein
MPAVSEKQREAMAIAEHEPSKLYKRNSAMKSMSHKQLHEFASKPLGQHKSFRMTKYHSKHEALKSRIGTGKSYYSGKTYKHD